MAKVTFDSQHYPFLLEVITVVHKILRGQDWSMHQVKVAVENGRIEQLDAATAQKIVSALKEFNLKNLIASAD